MTGVIPLLNLSFSGLGMVMAILAIAAGVLIVVGR
jgi:Na+-transporting methylmalonyl-CoA/oxaloacetate decarboxylase gamma subunit